MNAMVTDAETQKIKVICAFCKNIAEVEILIGVPRQMAEFATCPHCGTASQLKLLD